MGDTFYSGLPGSEDQRHNLGENVAQVLKW